jgi:uncharacterized membrane protein
MLGEYRQMILHGVAIIILIIVLFKIKDWVNTFVQKTSKKGGKAVRKLSQKRYANRVNKEEERLFGSERKKKRN